MQELSFMSLRGYICFSTNCFADDFSENKIKHYFQVLTHFTGTDSGIRTYWLFNKLRVTILYQSHQLPIGAPVFNTTFAFGSLIKTNPVS
jgi:hypothetical protein